MLLDGACETAPCGSEHIGLGGVVVVWLVIIDNFHHVGPLLQSLKPVFHLPWISNLFLYLIVEILNSL